MQKGTINVQTENIFPIIKKFLYSDHEIFLRELVSNAVDASQKLKTYSSKGTFTGELGELVVSVLLDKEKGTLTISDSGIGMTEEEVDKYINQIAFSSAQEFLEQYKDDQNIIGHFGLGFYSAFMVADKVEIQTLSHKDGAKAVKWECDGSPNYKITRSKKKSRGTDITLFIADDSKEFLEKSRIESLLKKYCKFLPVAIEFKEGKDEAVKINNTSPAWIKKATDLKDEDYLSFYKELYPLQFEDPLFWIHLDVEYPFKLTGVLFFPKIKNQIDTKKDRIHLYCNQVFVTEQVEEIVPEFLMLLQGVIDSPDIPLNVSRSYLQSDPNVKKISNYITKKVASKLGEMFKEDRKAFEEKWNDISIFIKYGMLTDEKFADKATDFNLLETVGDGSRFYTLDEYQTVIEASQTDKSSKTVVLYTTSEEEQDAYIKRAAEHGYSVVKFNQVIDPHFVGYLEQKNEKLNFKRVDAGTIGELIEKEDQPESVLNEEQEGNLKDLFKTVIDQNAQLEVKSLSPEDPPIVITKPELLRRMRDMSAYNSINTSGMMPETFSVALNANHSLISKLLLETDEKSRSKTVQQLYDIALLSQNMLKGSDLTAFVNRSIEMM